MGEGVRMGKVEFNPTKTNCTLLNENCTLLNWPFPGQNQPLNPPPKADRNFRKSRYLKEIDYSSSAFRCTSTSSLRGLRVDGC